MPHKKYKNRTTFTSGLNGTVYVLIKYQGTAVSVVQSKIIVFSMQKRNETKGESEKRYYEDKTYVSGD